MMEENKLYPSMPTPEVPTAPPADPGGHKYRLQQISVLKRQLEDEREKRAALYKMNRRAVNNVDGADTTMLTTGMALGVGGVGLLTTVIAAPIVVVLEGAALACGLLGAAGKFISRRLAVKAKKHDEIRVLADSKLNTIADHVSRAIMDGNVSDHEFRLILDEVEKYQQMRDQIRAGARKSPYGVGTPGAGRRDKKSSRTARQRRSSGCPYRKAIRCAIGCIYTSGREDDDPPDYTP